MKIVKRILLIILGIIAIPFVVALFVKNDYAVESNVIINKPKQEVFEYVKLLKNQDNYNKWTIEDKTIKQTAKGTDGTVGFVYAWEGEQSGAGEQEIKALGDGRLDTEIRFKKPMESIAQEYMVVDSISATSSKVTWGMKGTSNYPFNFMNLLSEQTIASPMSESLGLLKTTLESK